MNLFKKTVQNLSLPHCRKVRGYEIKRMPLGVYMAAMQKLETFPQDALQILFPGMSPDAILKQLKTIDTAMLGQIAMRAFSALPKYAAGVLEELTGIPEERLVNDPEIGLDGFVEIIDAWLEVNNIENFISTVRSLTGKAKARAGSCGSKS